MDAYRHRQRQACASSLVCEEGLKIHRDCRGWPWGGGRGSDVKSQACSTGAVGIKGSASKRCDKPGTEAGEFRSRRKEAERVRDDVGVVSQRGAGEEGGMAIWPGGPGRWNGRSTSRSRARRVSGVMYRGPYGVLHLLSSTVKHSNATRVDLRLLARFSNCQSPHPSVGARLFLLTCACRTKFHRL